MWAYDNQQHSLLLGEPQVKLHARTEVYLIGVIFSFWFWFRLIISPEIFYSISANIISNSAIALAPFSEDLLAAPILYKLMLSVINNIVGDQVFGYLIITYLLLISNILSSHYLLTLSTSLLTARCIMVAVLVSPLFFFLPIILHPQFIIAWLLLQCGLFIWIICSAKHKITWRITTLFSWIVSLVSLLSGFFGLVYTIIVISIFSLIHRTLWTQTAFRLLRFGMLWSTTLILLIAILSWLSYEVLEEIFFTNWNLQLFYSNVFVYHFSINIIVYLLLLMIVNYPFVILWFSNNNIMIFDLHTKLLISMFCGALLLNCFITDFSVALILLSGFSGLIMIGSYIANILTGKNEIYILLITIKYTAGILAIISLLMAIIKFDFINLIILSLIIYLYSKIIQKHHYSSYHCYTLISKIMFLLSLLVGRTAIIL